MKVIYNYAISTSGTVDVVPDFDECVSDCFASNCVEFSYDRFDETCHLSTAASPGTPVMTAGSDYYVACEIGMYWHQTCPMIHIELKKLELKTHWGLRLYMYVY